MVVAPDVPVRLKTPVPETIVPGVVELNVHEPPVTASEKVQGPPDVEHKLKGPPTPDKVIAVGAVVYARNIGVAVVAVPPAEHITEHL